MHQKTSILMMLESENLLTPARSVKDSILLSILREIPDIVKGEACLKANYFEKILLQIHPAQPHEAGRGQAVLGFQVGVGGAVLLPDGL